MKNVALGWQNLLARRMNWDEALPAIADYAEYERVRARPVAAWSGVVRAIAERHGVEAEAVERFAVGEAVVCGYGPWVIKLLPPFASEVARREVEALTHLRDAGLPVPRLVGSGEAGRGWHYLVMTRMEGRPLEELREELSAAERCATAGQMGTMLARLPADTADGCRPGGVAWATWRARWLERWPRRADVARLPAVLRESGAEYVRAWAGEEDEGEHGLLHGDLAPVNVMAERREGVVRVTAMIDLGNALAGPRLFDLTAGSVLHGRGERAVVHAMLAGFGLELLTPAVRRRLMAYTMLHPLGDLPECLQLVPGLVAARSWDEVAATFWPE